MSPMPSRTNARRPWWRFPLTALLSLGTLMSFPLGTAVAQEEEDDETYEEEVVVADDEIADDDPSAVIIFRERLAPHGAWIDHPDYGTLWVPSSKLVGPDFAPYVTSGRWELTDEGDWLWVSDYDWGYIPFHYGRWVWVSGLGWSWIPGRTYAPAWVVWRTGADGYIGWAPAPPSYYWVDGWSYSWWGVPVAAYVFCPTVHVFHHHVHTVVIHDHDHVHKAAKATRPYVPARARPQHTAANPTTNGGNQPRIGPTPDEAGIKKADLPKKTGKPSAKSLEFMKPESIAKSKAMSKAAAPPSKAPAVGSKAPATAKAAGVNGFVAPSKALDKPVKRATKSTPSLTVPGSTPKALKPSQSSKPAPKAQPYKPEPAFDYDDRPAPKTQKKAPKAQPWSSQPSPAPKAPKSKPHPQSQPKAAPAPSQHQPSPKAPSTSKKSPSAPSVRPNSPAPSAPKKAAPAAPSGGSKKVTPRAGKKSR